ncbi:MAG: serine hydrolase [Tardiphaga sp.]|nr:serine hydrolase [Tardiphaga sp.]
MIEMERSADWIKFILDRPMAKSPGESFTYNSGNPHLLSAILAKLTGMSAEDYARAKLFGPLGITDWKWRRDPQGVSTGGYGLSMHPRDMAKFGYLYLRGGEWEGKPLVSSDWIDKVTHAAVDMNAAFAPALRYSNLFWALPDSKVYWSQGYHCQMIIVYPAQDMVAVATGRDGCSLVSLITDIASTVKSEDALPANAAGAQLLAGAIRDAASLKPTAVGPMSPIAASISGKTYNFPRSSLALKSLALTFDDKHPTYELEFYNRNPNNPSQKLTGAIGLDGLYRKGEFAGAGVPAVRGKWLNDRTFEIERLTVGAGNPQQKWTLWFDGDLLSIRGMDYDRRDMTIDGRRGN